MVSLVSGYALDPTVDGSAEEGKTLIGAKEAAEESGAKTVFEITALREADRRKRKKNDDAADIEGFLGPWGGYVDEKRIMKPSDEEAAELEEILAKRTKRGKQVEEKPLEEKTVLHSKISRPFSLLNLFYNYIIRVDIVNIIFGNNDNYLLLLYCYNFFLAVKDSMDYQGRSFLHAPQDVGVNLRSESPPERCFLPKAQVHTWEGHTKGISQIKWFPRTAHLLLSCSMDCRVKVKRE